MQLSHIIILAIIQGIAEFLPISSSGHVVVVAALLSQEFDVADVNIFLHAGTLLSILVFYWYRIWMLLGEDRRTIIWLIVGTLPVVVIGVVVKVAFESILSNPLLAGCMLVVTGSMLLMAAKLKQGTGKYQELGPAKSLLIGVAQAFAILPGISRSGATISMGLACGLSRRDAATFSFLLAIPAIGGASLFEMLQIYKEASLSTAPAHLLVGAAISFVVGLFSLWWLLRWLERGRLEYFAYWCIPLGISIVAWQLSA